MARREEGASPQWAVTDEQRSHRPNSAPLSLCSCRPHHRGPPSPAGSPTFPVPPVPHRPQQGVPLTRATGSLPSCRVVCAASCEVTGFGHCSRSIHLMNRDPVPPHAIEQIVHLPPPDLPEGAIVPTHEPLNLLRYRAIKLAAKQRFQALANLPALSQTPRGNVSPKRQE